MTGYRLNTSASQTSAHACLLRGRHFKALVLLRELGNVLYMWGHSAHTVRVLKEMEKGLLADGGDITVSYASP